MQKGKIPCVLAVRFLDFQGKHVLGERWPAMTESLCSALDRRAGAPRPDGGPARWTFDDLPDARSCWEQAVREAKMSHGWQSHHGAVPVQALLCPAGESGFDRWEYLAPGSLYLTPALQRDWELLFDPHHDAALPLLEEKACGAFRVTGAAPEQQRWLSLFPGRGLPVRRQGRRCFYCGSSNHHPADCPSKRLGPETYALAATGAMPVSELALCYEKAFADEERCVRELHGGVDPAALRDDPVLQAYLAYFDLGRAYQVRMLIYLCFCRLDSWPGIGPLGRVKPAAGNTLHLALDCLRVGNLSQAAGLLRSLEGVDADGRFFVEVALAFVSLEEQDLEGMRAHLEKARKLARKPEELTYIALLRSRFYEIYGGHAGLGHAVNAALDTAGRCAEVEYRLLQLSVRQNLCDGVLDQLRGLIRRHREYFVVALVDPELGPVRGPVEGMLAAMLQGVLSQGRTAFRRVQGECTELMEWLGAEERSLASVWAGVTSLEDRVCKESYLGHVELIKAAEKLELSCLEVRQRRVHRLLRGVDRLGKELDGLARRWQGYPHKRFYRRYPALLGKLADAHRQAAGRLVEETTAAYREADRLLTAAERRAAELDGMWPEMVWLRNGIEFALRFVRRLAISEVVAIPLGLLAVPLLSLALGGDGAAGSSVLASAGFRRAAFFLLVFVLAPTTAGLAALVGRPPGRAE